MKETVSVAGSAGSSADIATSRLAELQDRVSHLSSRLAELRQQLAAVEAEGIDANDVEAALHDFDPLWEQLSTWEQERFISTLVEHIRYDGKTGTVTLGFRSRGIKEFCGWAPDLTEEYNISMPNSAVEIQFRLHTTGRLPGGAGPPDAPASGNGRLPRVTQVVALTIQLQDMIQRGEARDYADLARLGCLTRERMSQIMELLWLAPDIQQEILEFQPSGSARFPISEVAVRRIASVLSWDEQRQAWKGLRTHHNLI